MPGALETEEHAMELDTCKTYFGLWIVEDVKSCNAPAFVACRALIIISLAEIDLLSFRVRV